ncbi:hypothetical protein BYT27DRAFT_7294756 [Phlegmacium glaucopus]|nr:hypothetical protein BYT27DRAFT_7294756 [Phlegmacium glaucopus]
MSSQATERLRHRGRLKAPNIPVSILLDNFVESSSPHPPEIAPVFNTMTRIWAASAIIDSIQRDKEENSHLPTAMLDRVSPLSKLLWEEILLLLQVPSTIPSLQSSLTKYELILVEIEQILSSNDPLRMSDDTIDRQLDDFMVQFQESLNPLKCTISQRNSLNAMRNIKFFEYFISNVAFYLAKRVTIDLWKILDSGVELNHARPP